MGSIIQGNFNMRTLFVLLALASIACAQIARKSIADSLVETGKDGCFTCVDDIVKAVADCANTDLDVLVCVTDALGAASDCVNCICEILQIIGGFDDVCP